MTKKANDDGMSQNRINIKKRVTSTISASEIVSTYKQKHQMRFIRQHRRKKPLEATADSASIDDKWRTCTIHNKQTINKSFRRKKKERKQREDYPGGGGLPSQPTHALFPPQTPLFFERISINE